MADHHREELKEALPRGIVGRRDQRGQRQAGRVWVGGNSSRHLLPPDWLWKGLRQFPTQLGEHLVGGAGRFQFGCR